MLGTDYSPQRRLENTGRPIRVCAGGDAELVWRPIGHTIAWELVTAATAAGTVPIDGTPYGGGDKFIRYGTIMVPVSAANAAEQQTVDLSGDDDPTGGTWPLTVTGYGTLTGLAWNISAADLQTAIRALHADLATLTVAKASFVYTVTFPAGLGNVPPMTSDATGLTGGLGDTFAITITTTVPGVSANRKWAPFDANASDGRQTLARGAVGIVDMTIRERDLYSDVIGLIEGGLLWSERLNVGSSPLPALAAVVAVMPLVRFAPAQ